MKSNKERIFSVGEDRIIVAEEAFYRVKKISNGFAFNFDEISKILFQLPFLLMLFL